MLRPGGVANPLTPSRVVQMNKKSLVLEDQLIQQAMMTSVDPTIAPIATTAPSDKRPRNFFTSLLQIRATLAFLADETNCKILRKLLNPLRNTYKRFAPSLMSQALLDH